MNRFLRSACTVLMLTAAPAAMLVLPQPVLAQSADASIDDDHIIEDERGAGLLRVRCGADRRRDRK